MSDAPIRDAPARAAKRAPSTALGVVVRATIGRLISRGVYRTITPGVENVPTATGAVLAGNHESYLDPAMLWCVTPRPCHFMAKRELFTGVMGWALPRLWSFPVERGAPDRTAITTAVRYLEAGDLVGIFPEGTRRVEGVESEVHGGAAFIALKAGVPIVPVAFVGTDRAWPKGQKLPRPGRLTFKYGTPVYPSQFAEGTRKEQVAAMTAEVMRRIGEELVAAKEIDDAR